MKSQSPTHVDIFLSERIVEASAGSLASALREVNFKTLCQQYGLDPGGIKDVLTYLRVLGSPASAERPFFIVKYGVKLHQTLVIEVWDTAEPKGKTLLEAVLSGVDSAVLKKRLEKTVRILSIDLFQPQLCDMGLLLAYEVARWAGFHGKGLIRGLDGFWYSLNQHRAFIPFKETLDY